MTVDLDHLWTLVVDETTTPLDINEQLALLTGWRTEQRGFTNRNGSTERRSFWIPPGWETDDYIEEFSEPLYDLPDYPPNFTSDYGLLTRWMQQSLNGWDLTITIHLDGAPQAGATLTHGRRAFAAVRMASNINMAISLAVIEAMVRTLRDAQPLTADPNWLISADW